MSSIQQKWTELSSIQLGGAICLPIILIGHEVAKTAGLGAALIALVIGNLLLFALSLIASVMSVESRKTTAENAERYFGRVGTVFFALMISVSLACWFAIQTQVMSHDVGQLLHSRLGIAVPEFLLNGLFAAIMIGCAFFGLKGVTLLANCTLPLMILTLGASVYFQATHSEKSILQEEITGFSPAGISLVIAAVISAVVDLPTFFRHAATKRDALITSVVTFLIGVPLVELIGVLLGYWASSGSLTDALTCVDMPLFQIWVCLFIVFAGWTTNNTNFYSAAMSLTSLSSTITEKRSYVLVGIACLTLSFLPLMQNLMLVLDCMGIFVASMGGVVLTGYSLSRCFGARVLDTVSHRVAWAVGVVAGVANIMMGGLLSPIAILDALTLSGLTLIVLRLRTIVQKEVEHEIYN